MWTWGRHLLTTCTIVKSWYHLSVFYNLIKRRPIDGIPVLKDISEKFNSLFIVKAIKYWKKYKLSTLSLSQVHWEALDM